MKNTLLGLLFFLLGTSALAAQPHIDSFGAEGRPFLVVQISDPQMGFREQQGFAESEQLLRRTVEAINTLRPALVVVTGDMVNNSGDEAQQEAYWRLIGGVSASIPVFHLPGNHDIGRSTPDNTAAYIKRYGYTRFAFRYGDCALIGIDTCPIRDNAAQAEAEQYKWLARELEAARDARAIFVFQHCPVVLADRHEKESYSNFSEPMRQRYLELFGRHGVKAVFAGHLHNTAYCKTEGIELITCGPSGKPLGTGFSGMNLIRIYPDGSFLHQYEPLPEAAQVEKTSE